MEQTLRDSEAKYRAILENSQDIITILNEDGVVTYANPALTEVLGHAVGDVLGKNVLEYLHPSDAPAVIKLLGELHQQPGAAAKTEVRLRRADGCWRLLEVSSKHIPESRLLGGIVINARDVTEGRRVQDEARESEDRQRLLFDLAPDAYFLCDFKGRLADCNRAFEGLAGAGREALAGRSLWDLNLLPIDQAPELTALLARNARGEEAGPDAFTLSGADGRAFRAEIKTHPVKIKGQPLVLGVVTDVTASARERDHEQEHYRGLE
ncbi:MAG: PAS domain S-box protein, partial [Candidatus Edwardsbacteria bacterium]|nr:PAS domain S-box protein [Candidatus Edwardsbacteria bacterium]